MGQKVNPIGFRLGSVQQWRSQWYVNSKDYADWAWSDIQAREYITKKLAHASVSTVHFERTPRNAKVKIRAARPGTIIGKSGKDVEILKKEVAGMLGTPVHITIEEVRKPALDSQLVADNIAQQLEKRVMFRRAMKRAVSSAMRAGAKGVKVSVSGRLGGAEIARREWYREGRVPLHTIRADIDYAVSEALTTYGIIGVKVWIYKGDVIGQKPVTAPAEETTADSKE